MSTAAVCKELVVDAGYGDIMCKVWGNDSLSAHKFLAIHGWMDNAGLFDPFIKHFYAEDRCIVCIDLPGHGLSSHLPKGVLYTTEREMYAISCVIKCLGWQKFKLIGHSLGANLCQTHAMICPKGVEAIISFDGFILPLELVEGEMDEEDIRGRSITFDSLDKVHDNFIDLTSRLPKKNKEYSYNELAEKWLGVLPGLTMEEFDIFTRRGARKLDNGKYVYTRDVALHLQDRTVLRFPLATIIQKIQKMKDIPQIVITNGTFNKLNSETVGETLTTACQKIADAYPAKFDIVKVEGGHHFFMQQPKLTASIVNKFLDQISKSAPASKL